MTSTKTRHAWYALTFALCAACKDGTAPAASTPLGGFDAVWQAFDVTYPYFGLKGVDWNASRTRHRPEAAQATEVSDLNQVLLGMLEPLHDQHVSLQSPDGQFTATWRSPNAGNFDQAQWQRTVLANGWEQVKINLGIARFDGIPYIAIGSWNTSQFAVADLDALLDRVRNDAALIIDVRPNGGGDDQLALAFAARFADAPRLTEVIRSRTGPRHTDLGNEVRRTLAPRGPWTYGGRVIVLTGRRSLSSNESFVAAMRVQPRVITAGDTTGGGTANPKPFPYFAGWKVWVSSWYAELPDGKPIEGLGIAPQVYVPFSATASFDPVIGAAVSLARTGMP